MNVIIPVPFHFCAFCASSRQRGFPHLSRRMAHVPSNRLRTVVFQAGLKAAFCPALASSGPVCPGIALLLAHCLAARPLPPAYGLGDGAKPPENRQNLPVDALHQLWQDGAGMNESEKQFSFTRAASSTTGGAKSNFLSVIRTIIIGLCALALGATVAARAAPPVITNITMVGMTPQFAVQSDLGITNQIQCCTNLSQTNWVTLTNLLVAQSPYWFVHVAAPAASQRFYRVVAVPASTPPPSGTALIPAGSFTMGNCMDPSEGDSWELPLHTVSVSAFYMDQYLVTKSLWDTVCQWAIAHGYSFDHAGSGKASTHPVQSIDWYDSVKWCNARSEMEGKTPAYYTDAGLSVRYRTGQVEPYVNWGSGYRLPTEAEWEKAARGGASGQRFPWGNTISWSQANYYAYPFSAGGYAYDVNPTSGYNPAWNSEGPSYTSPVGTFAANGYGLYDMADNVYQFCWDWWGSYSSGSQTDPRGPATGSGRVGRGGSWVSYANGCRVAGRCDEGSTFCVGYIGFRSVLPAGQ